jgi:hypothetical protein
VYVSESLRAALAAYPTTPHPADGSLPRLNAEDSAHLKRWTGDDRTDEVWNTIHRAAQDHGMPLPPRVFIQTTLGARKVAKSMNHRRADRERYRKLADQMMRIAKFLRTPLPNSVLLIPTGVELARGLDEAAKKCREYVAVSHKLPFPIRCLGYQMDPKVQTVLCFHKPIK